MINIDDENEKEYTIEGEQYKTMHDKLKEMNESNAYLYINNKKYKFKKYFNFKNVGEYNIKLKLNFLMKEL